MRFTGLIPMTMIAAASPFCAGPASADDRVLAVTLTQPAAAVPAPLWSFLKRLDIRPLVLVNPPAADVNSAFDFAGLRQDLEACAQQGFPLSVFATTHLSHLTKSPQVDEEGGTWNQRHNPYDPAFLGEWDRYVTQLRDLVRTQAGVERIYITMPSFFGETEYFLGTDWARPRLLAYDALARARFGEWLARRRGSPAVVAAAWGVGPFGRWEDTPIPPYAWKGETLRSDNAWLDLMEWRTEYIARLMVDRFHLVAEGLSCQVAYMCSVGDSSAIWGSNSDTIVAECADLPRFVWHMTNGHSLADLKYATTLARQYGLERVVTENDGGRYGRTEIAKIVLNLLLTGADEFNYSYDKHLVDATPDASLTESARALGDARALLSRIQAKPARKAIAFLKSRTTARVRPPRYLNRDVAHVYDGALINTGDAEPWSLDWGRYLELPDVIGERAILDGGLEGRRLLVIPNTSQTVLPRSVRDRVLAWVQSGGCLAVFGAEGFAYALEEAPPAPGQSRCVRVADWPAVPVQDGEGALAPTEAGRASVATRPWVHLEAPAPVWTRALGAGWQTLFADGAGHDAVAEHRLGQGRIVLFAGPVPVTRPERTEAFFRREAPLLLRALAEVAGCPFAFSMFAADSAGMSLAFPVAADYIGRDAKTGRHVFVMGAYDGSVARVRFVPSPALQGEAEVLLVDLASVGASAEGGTAPLRLVRSCPSPYAHYGDPTNREAEGGFLIPWTSIVFRAPDALLLALGPDRLESSGSHGP
jgi:hypothetical protein